MLCNLYVERAFSEAISENTIGIKVNGIPINNIRYADDTVILAENANDLQALLEIGKSWISLKVSGHVFDNQLFIYLTNVLLAKRIYYFRLN